MLSESILLFADFIIISYTDVYYHGKGGCDVTWPFLSLPVRAALLLLPVNITEPQRYLWPGHSFKIRSCQGPVHAMPMYQVKPVCGAHKEVDLPTCMYKIPNIHTQHGNSCASEHAIQVTANSFDLDKFNTVGCLTLYLDLVLSHIVCTSLSKQGTR